MGNISNKLAKIGQTKAELKQVLLDNGVVATDVFSSYSGNFGTIFTATANAIRQVDGTSADIKAVDFAERIAMSEVGTKMLMQFTSKGYYDDVLTFPKNITTITTNAFAYNTFIRGGVVIGNNIISLGNSSFRESGITGMAKIDLTGGWNNVPGNFLFYKTAVTSCEYNAVVVSAYALSGCVNLTSVLLGTSVQQIADNAFKDSLNLKKVKVLRTLSIMTLPNSNAFMGTHNDLKIYVPDNLVSGYKTATNWASLAGKIYGHSEEV